MYSALQNKERLIIEIEGVGEAGVVHGLNINNRPPRIE